MFFVLPIMTCRLSEAMIEKTEPAAGDVRHQAVEHFAVCFVRVETEIEIISQKPPALRDAEAVHSLNGGFAVRAAQRISLAGVVAKKREQIAHAGIAEPLHDRPFRLADQFVDVPGSETA